MTKVYHDGDLDYSSILLKSIDGQKQLDITNQCISMDIYESILSPIVKAELVVYDPLDILQSFPIQGEELVEFSFKTGTEEKDIECKLTVVSAEAIQIDVSNRSKTYVLRLTSEELYRAQKQLVQKHYKQQIHHIIKDILYNDIQTDKMFQAEITKGIEDLTITHKKPFEAIDFCRRRAVSPTYISSSFCFYESIIHPGFYLKTLETIFKDGQKNSTGDQKYKFFTNTSESILISNFRNIIAYEHVNLASTVNQIQRGGLNNRVTSLDLVTGKLTNFDYKNPEYQKIDSNAQDLHTGNFVQNYGDDISTWYFTAVDSSLNEPEIPEKVGQIQGFVQNITSSLLHIHVYGDSMTGVGDVIEVTLPDATGSTNSKEAPMVSGNYLVAKCRHMLTFGNYRNYTQSFELIKGSYLGGQ